MNKKLHFKERKNTILLVNLLTIKNKINNNFLYI